MERLFSYKKTPSTIYVLSHATVAADSPMPSATARVTDLY